MLASLHHKNLVQVYTLGEHAGDVYFVMELVEGQPLVEVLRTEAERGEWLPNGVVTQITLEIADALDAMHAVGLIHRDNDKRFVIHVSFRSKRKAPKRRS